jgi:hypothetical protein
VTSFEISRFKLFTLKFSNKSVRSLKLLKGRMFLLFEYNNCIQTRHQYQAASQFLHMKLRCRSPALKEKTVKIGSPSQIFSKNVTPQGLDFQQRYLTDIGSIACSYFSVVVIIGGEALKIRQSLKKTNCYVWTVAKVIN